jgi:hypothetical protein
MSTNAALGELRIPAKPAPSERYSAALASIRRLAHRPRWPERRLYLNVGDSYRIPDGRSGYQCRSTWVHVKH